VKINQTPAVVPKHYWCYMNGVGTFGGTLSAVIGIPGDPTDPYTEDIPKGTTLWWNCLPFKQ